MDFCHHHSIKYGTVPFSRIVAVYQHKNRVYSFSRGSAYTWQSYIKCSFDAVSDGYSHSSQYNSWMWHFQVKDPEKMEKKTKASENFSDTVVRTAQETSTVGSFKYSELKRANPSKGGDAKFRV